MSLDSYGHAISRAPGLVIHGHPLYIHPIPFLELLDNLKLGPWTTNKITSWETCDDLRNMNSGVTVSPSVG